MAFIKPNHVDPVGTVYQNSYWFGDETYTSVRQQCVCVSFVGFASLEAYQSGRNPIPGGSKIYFVGPDQCMSVLGASPIGNSVYAVNAHEIESYALGKKDTLVDGVLVSFFENAQQV